eukprot:scaffold7614_cov417-Prasinococcus_capsulatus_cf.AAC.7
MYVPGYLTQLLMYDAEGSPVLCPPTNCATRCCFTGPPLPTPGLAWPRGAGLGPVCEPLLAQSHSHCRRPANGSPRTAFQARQAPARAHDLPRRPPGKHPPLHGSRPESR